MNPLKMYFLLKMGIFHCHVSLLEGNTQGLPMLTALRGFLDEAMAGQV